MIIVKYIPIDTYYEGRTRHSIHAVLSDGTERLVVYRNFSSFDEDFRNKLVEELNRTLKDC